MVCKMDFRHAFQRVDSLLPRLRKRNGQLEVIHFGDGEDSMLAMQYHLDNYYERRVPRNT